MNDIIDFYVESFVRNLLFWYFLPAHIMNATTVCKPNVSENNL